MTPEKYDKIIAGSLIYRNNNGIREVLAIRRSQYSSWPGEWEFSRGKIDEKDSTAMDAAKREAKEEVGLDVKPYQLFDKYEYRKTEDGNSTRVLQKNYICKPVDMDAQVKLDINEHDRFRWIRSEDDLPFKNEVKETIKKVFDMDEKEVKYFDEPIKTIVGESVVFDL